MNFFFFFGIPLSLRADNESPEKEHPCPDFSVIGKEDWEWTVKRKAKAGRQRGKITFFLIRTLFSLKLGIFGIATKQWVKLYPASSQSLCLSAEGRAEGTQASSIHCNHLTMSQSKLKGRNLHLLEKKIPLLGGWFWACIWENKSALHRIKFLPLFLHPSTAVLLKIMAAWCLNVLIQSSCICYTKCTPLLPQFLYSE